MDTRVIEIVVAMGSNYVIGKDGDLPWRGKLPADMQRFKELTTGNNVIMGRKTWESLPPKYRPLPDRNNIVITRQMDYLPFQAYRADSLAQALEQCLPGRIFVIGGAQLYREALPLAKIVHLTLIHETFPGDAYFPKLTMDEWLTEQKDYSADEKNRYRYSFITLLRRLHGER